MTLLAMKTEGSERETYQSRTRQTLELLESQIRQVRRWTPKKEEDRPAEPVLRALDEAMDANRAARARFHALCRLDEDSWGACRTAVEEAMRELKDCVAHASSWIR